MQTCFWKDVETDSSVRRMTPVLKWAGGKTQLLDQIIANMPSVYNDYYEPFIGGGAVLLGLAPNRAIINDINGQLVNLYVQLKNSPECLINMINELDSFHCTKERYYLLRERYNFKIVNSEYDVESAALMIWINKHCFNGLYRVNKKGLFNVPYNNKTCGRSIDESNLRAISNYLNHNDITITCHDFEKACETVSDGDFVYFDSPYVPESLTASFTDYTLDGFTYKDHLRLASLFKKLDRLGAKVLLSNNDVPLVRSLYKGYDIITLEVKRMINRDASKRTGKEVLVRNY